jgi:hypothetical protein
MSDVSCVIFYAGKMLQTIEFPQVALNINLFEDPLYVYSVWNKIHVMFLKKALGQVDFISRNAIL